MLIPVPYVAVMVALCWTSPHPPSLIAAQMITSNLLCSSWEQVGSKRTWWSCLAGLGRRQVRLNAPNMGQVLEFGPQPAVGLRGSQGRGPGTPAGSFAADCPAVFVRLQATVVCDLVLLYLDAKADVYWKEKFEEVRMGLLQREGVEFCKQI